MPLDTPSGSEKISRKPDRPKSARSVEDMAMEATQAQALETDHRREEAEEWPPVEAEILAELDAIDEPEDAGGEGMDDLFDERGEGDEAFDALFGDAPLEDPELTDPPEDPETRLAELADWVAANFPECRPYDEAARICFANEAEDPEYRAEDDPDLEGHLREKLSVKKSAERNETEVAAPDLSQDTDLETVTSLTEGMNKREENLSQADIALRYSDLLEKTGDNRAAIARLVAETENPAYRKKLTGILRTFAAIDAVVPVADQEAMNRLLASTPLNLAGVSSIEAFAPVLRAMDASPEISEDAKTAVREAIYRQRYINTGSEVRDAATAVRIDPQTGERIPYHTAEHPHPVRPGVATYTETGDEVLVRLELPGHPPVIRDVTGWSDDDIGLLSEAMGFAAGLESFGATAAVEDIYKIDFALLGDSAFDRDSLRRIRQMISAMVGAFEGYDGDIFDPRRKEGLIRYQVRLISGQDTAYGWENDREASLESLRRLGLHDAEGRLNPPVLKAFGDLTQRSYLSTEMDHATLHAALYQRFPGFVGPPDDAYPMAA